MTEKSHERRAIEAGAEAQALAEALANYDDIDRALGVYNSVRQPLNANLMSTFTPGVGGAMLFVVNEVLLREGQSLLDRCARFLGGTMIL
jgi:hypothetical protein